MSTENHRVVIVTADDWTGVYLNGKLLDENHSIRAADLARYAALHDLRFTLGAAGLTPAADAEMSEKGGLNGEVGFPEDFLDLAGKVDYT